MKGAEQLLVVGRLGAPFGVKGWIHVQSFTEPEENIQDYVSWYISVNKQTPEQDVFMFQPDSWKLYEQVIIKHQHGGMIAKIAGIEDRTQAGLYTGRIVAVSKQALPALSDNEYYWSDLIGLRVENLESQSLGVVDSLVNFGASDMLVVKNPEMTAVKARYIPFVMGDFIKEVDLIEKVITVDWDLDL